MPDMLLLATAVNVIGLPILGLTALLAIKLTIGDSLRKAQRGFFLALLLIGLVTMRTVSSLDDAWLIHTVTLAAMIMGAFTVPGRENAATLA